MWQKIKDGFSGLFNFDFKFPNFKSYLPKWLGGEGKSLSSLFSGGDSASQNTQTAQIEKMNTESDEKVSEMADKVETKTAEKKVATNLEEAGANAINIQLAELIEVTKKSNKLISALNGNVMAG